MRDLQGRKSEEFLYGEETADNDAGHQRDHPRSWGSPEVRYGTGGSPQALGRGEREEEGGSRFLASLGGDETEAYIHTLLRSLRRWMEKLKDKITAVVLVVNSGYDSQEEEEDLKAYEHFVKLYFPRSLREEVGRLLMRREAGRGEWPRRLLFCLLSFSLGIEQVARCMYTPEGKREREGN